MAERAGRRGRRGAVAGAVGGRRPAGSWSSPVRRVVRLVPDEGLTDGPPEAPLTDAIDGERAPEERVEAFVVRTALGPGGEPLRSRVIHVRRQVEISSAGWAPDQMVVFMEDCLRIPRSVREATVSPAAAPAGEPEPHVVDLDAGTVIGGSTSDVESRVATAGVAPFTFTAVLSGRPYGAGHADEQAWTRLARCTGSAVAGEHLSLRFAGVPVPRGLHRLRLRITVRASKHPPPVLEVLARRG